MSLTQLCWMSIGAYALHVLEKYILNWKDWAHTVLHLPAEWGTFYVTNAAVIVLGVVAAEIASTLPIVALGFPALMLINATLFHVGPFIAARGRFSPGLLTALLFFFPLGIAAFATAGCHGSLTLLGVVVAFAIGTLLMFTPIVFLKLKGKPYFQQPL